jgi:hypothetical protein
VIMVSHPREKAEQLKSRPQPQAPTANQVLMYCKIRLRQLNEPDCFDISKRGERASGSYTRVCDSLSYVHGK